MSAIFVLPLRFTVGASTGWQTIAPVSNLNIDEPGMVAKSSGSSASFTVNLGGSQTFDTVALIGSNLPSNATVTVSGQSPVAAYTGFKDAGTSTKTILQFGATTASSVTITISAPSAFQIQRLVIGKRLESYGIDQGCDNSFEDQSVIEKGAGHTSIERFNTLSSWKASISWIEDTRWRQEFKPFFRNAGQNRGILFVPQADDPTTFQEEAVFGRFDSVAKGKYNNHNNWTVEFVITELAP